jgi:hypothetical protein
LSISIERVLTLRSRSIVSGRSEKCCKRNAKARIETVTDIIAKFAKSHEKRLQDHINIETSRLLNVNNITKRLKRKKPFELVRHQNTK